MEKQLKFIDLFAGLGGFHIALSKLGCKCVFACEIKEDLRDLYEENFHIKPAGDITKVDYKKIPQHDILCAGFPCQPFSQAGYRQGFDDEKGRGNMFYRICDIIDAQGDKKPTYLLLENVANLKGHDHGNTWKTIQKLLRERGYDVKEEVLSPHQFGYPQHRKRIYIVGVRIDRGGLKGFEFPKPTDQPCNIKEIIDESETDIQTLKPETISQLKKWQLFLKLAKAHNVSIPKFPIWAMEFGADYEFRLKAPYYQTFGELRRHRGKLGKAINGQTKEECIAQLPIYAQSSKSEVFPNWKITYIEKNRDFYQKNKKWIDTWLSGIKHYSNSHMKFEWNVSTPDDIDINKYIVQFRASGIRVKDATFSPALNLVGTQVPILPGIKLPKSCIPNVSQETLEKYGLTKEDFTHGRYLSVKEAAKLQGMESLRFEDEKVKLTKSRIYEALGNAVNTQVVKMIAEKLLKIEL